MKTLPVIDMQKFEKREMLERINLNNRPRLNFNLNQLDQVAGSLASNHRDRERFVENPVGYLKDRGIEVPSATLVRAKSAQTAEVCSGPVAVCTVILLVAAAAVAVVLSVFELWSGDMREPRKPVNQQAQNFYDPASQVWL